MKARAQSPHLDLTRAQWRKSRYSTNGSSCVEVAFVDSAVAVRDSQNPTEPALILTRDAWAVFTAGVKDDQFDL